MKPRIICSWNPGYPTLWHITVPGYPVPWTTCTWREALDLVRHWYVEQAEPWLG